MSVNPHTFPCSNRIVQSVCSSLQLVLCMACGPRGRNFFPLFKTVNHVLLSTFLFCREHWLIPSAAWISLSSCHCHIDNVVRSWCCKVLGEHNPFMTSPDLFLHMGCSSDTTFEIQYIWKLGLTYEEYLTVSLLGRAKLYDGMALY